MWLSRRQDLPVVRDGRVSTLEPTFSERFGFAPPRTLQVRSVDDQLRDSIWNLLVTVVEAGRASDGRRIEAWKAVGKRIAVAFLRVAVDEVRLLDSWDLRRWLRARFLTFDWYRIYDFLEFMAGPLVQLGEVLSTPAHVTDVANKILERERSAYRFIGGRLAPISNEGEAAAIEEALSRSDRVGLALVHEHLQKALGLFGRRPEPDYLNAMKEAISAVESAAKCVSGVTGGGLKAALGALADKAGIHPALKEGLLKLYGYASDEDGVRHGMVEQPDLGYDEAKLMVVVCSAFANFLISKADAAGLLKP